MTLSKVRVGEVVAGVGGIGLIAVMFAPWYDFVPGPYPGSRFIPDNETTQSAWQALTVSLVPLVLVALLGITLLGVTLFQRTQAWPVAAEVFLAFFGTITSIIMLVRLANPPGPNFAADRKWGVWVGTVLVIAVTEGAWWSMRDEDRP